MHRDIWGNISKNLAGIHVRGVHSTRFNAMVLLDDWIKNRSKILVSVPISSIYTTMLIGKMNRNLDGFPECKSRGFSFNISQLIPFLSGHILFNQRLLGFDVGEVPWSHFKGCCWGWGWHEGIDRQHVTCCISTKISIARFGTSIDLIGNIANG